MTLPMPYLVIIRPADERSNRYIPLKMECATEQEAQQLADLLRPKLPVDAVVEAMRPQSETGVRYVPL